MDYKAFKVFDLEKISSHFINIPQLPKIYNLRRGIYMWLYKGTVIKVGIFGEGTKSNASTRYASYRSVNKNIKKYLNRDNKNNGSVVPILTLINKLLVGEKIEVVFKEIPENKIIDGYPYKVDLYQLEENYKQKYKDTLWLN